MSLEQLKHMIHIPAAVRQQHGSSTESTIDRDLITIDLMNATPGKLSGYDCPICKNKGVVYFLQDGYEVSRTCECMAIRQSRARLKASGLETIMQKYRFDCYEIQDTWQKEFKNGALKYMIDHDRKWFFAGGQPGTGKTHICTALAAQFLKYGLSVRYMLWKDESTVLKAVVNDDAEYSRKITPLKAVQVLYIDDLFKSGKEDEGKKPPTPGDINLAFEILNYRYNGNAITILSSERTIEELIDVDEALGSRIYQRTKEYCFSFDPDRSKNFRLRR